MNERLTGYSDLGSCLWRVFFFGLFVFGIV